MRRMLLVLLGLVLLVLGAGVGSLQAKKYTFHDLGTLGGAGSEARAINASGQVVGHADLYGNRYHAFLYSYPGGPMQDLGTLEGRNSGAYGINDKGQVVGTSLLYEDAPGHAFLYSYPGGPMQDLGTLGGTYSLAHGINASGQVVGMSYLTGNIPGDNSYHAFLYSYPGGPMQDLGTLGGPSQAMAINASGQVVGVSGTPGHAFLYSYPGGPMQDLGTLGGTSSIANGINDKGQVVGTAYLPLVGNIGNHHAFLYPYPGGPMQDLGTLGGSSEANSINASGQVVGESGTTSANSTFHAFIYTNGQMQDLNELVDLPLGVYLASAYGINDKGWIVGKTNFNRAYLLTKNQPLPAILLLLLGD